MIILNENHKSININNKSFIISYNDRNMIDKYNNIIQKCKTNIII